MRVVNKTIDPQNIYWFVGLIKMSFEKYKEVKSVYSLEH